IVMAPVSLIFLSVPVSSSALACPAQSTAASARPIITRRFIRSLLEMSALTVWTVTEQLPAAIRRAQPLQRLGQRMSRQPSHRLVGIRIGGIGRLGELGLQLRADRRVEGQSPGRNLLRKP